MKIGQKNVTSRVLTKKTAPPRRCHTNSVLTRKLPCPLAALFFKEPELSLDIIITNVQTKFHKDCTENKISRVLTRNTAWWPYWTKNATSRVFQLDKYIVGTNLLTKFHEDQTIILNVAARVLTNQNVDKGRRTMHDKQKVIQKLTIEHIVLR
ncbi:hypothetical protein DPMN_108240 [Dreissena polymorpha]|uniref:Uncharacterized protein n=1 Tax=Dreissena polymorpha TaxID=45954 RepID=A0A9D4K860_DREPO|nr:hypothetical protein DPMN_108240 [Dreissena polymorpha]